MCLAYIDESGSPDFTHNLPYFILTAFIIPEDLWGQIDRRWNLLKRRIYENKIKKGKKRFKNFEIHLSEINCRNSKGCYKGLLDAHRIEIMDEIFYLIRDLIIEYNMMKIISTVYIKIPENKNKEYHDPLRINLEHLLERIDNFANWDLNKDDKVILLFDKANEKRTSEIIKVIKENGTVFQQINNIIENPMFVDSRTTNLIQIADSISYLLGKYLTLFLPKNDLDRSLIMSRVKLYMDLVLPAFRGFLLNIKGRGIKIYPDNIVDGAFWDFSLKHLFWDYN
ncbi:MAG: DUF3800 domain-containing protein [Promethearchaeota archaeon]